MSGYETDVVTRLETNLDDCSPEILAAATQQLLAAGALDVWLTPILMKKGRVGTMLSVLAEETTVPALAELIFRETTAFGLRVEKITRLKLARRFVEVETPHGAVTIKLGEREDEILQAAPEYESCRALAQKTGTPLPQIYAAAQSAAQALRG